MASTAEPSEPKAVVERKRKETIMVLTKTRNDSADRGYAFPSYNLLMANFEDLHDDVLIFTIQFVRYRPCPSNQRLPSNMAPLPRACRRLRTSVFP